jgi:hypothetical protein
VNTVVHLIGLHFSQAASKVTTFISHIILFQNLLTVLDQLLSKQRNFLWLFLGHLGDEGVHNLISRRRRHRITISDNDERKSDGHGKSRIKHLINQGTNIV